MHISSHHQVDAVAEGMQLVMVFAAVIVGIALLLIFDKIEETRFRRWRNRYGYMEKPLKPWRTLVLWHRTGSRWYRNRVDGVDPIDGRLGTNRAKDPYSSYDSPFRIRGGYSKRDRRGGGNFGDGRGSGASNYSSGPK